LVGLVISPKAVPFRITSSFPFIAPHDRVPPDWMEVQLWARNHTPEDSLFLTPPELLGFRVNSLRSTVVEYKDGAPLAFAPLPIIEWWQRMEKFGYKLDLKKEKIIKPKAIANSTLREVAGQYHAAYIIVAKPARLELPLKFQNSSYLIYENTGLLGKSAN
jgi:hypothetical protein